MEPHVIVESKMEDYGDWIWDEAEYNFFMSLTDPDKLEYVFDFFNQEEFDFDEIAEFELESSGPTSESVDVEVVITESHLIIFCDKNQIIDRTINMFIMDGFLLSHQETKGNSRTYKLVGQENPISLN